MHGGEVSLASGRAGATDRAEVGHPNALEAEEHELDERVRQTPERAYDADFYRSFATEVGWRLG